jgi:hypothetical protein
MRTTDARNWKSGSQWRKVCSNPFPLRTRFLCRAQSPPKANIHRRVIVPSFQLSLSYFLLWLVAPVWCASRGQEVFFYAHRRRLYLRNQCVFFYFAGAKFGVYNPLYTIVLYKKETVCGYHWYQISFRQCGQWIIGIETLHLSHNRGFNKLVSFTYNRSLLWYFLRSDLKPLLILLALIYQVFDSHDTLRMYIICLRSDMTVIFCHWRRTLKIQKFLFIQKIIYICQPSRSALLRRGIYYYRLKT